VKRRDFILLLGGAASAAWPLEARAQQKTKPPTIGVLGVATARTWEPSIAVFVQRLGDLGWVEGRDVKIEYRWAEGHTERFAALADELVNLNVDVIVTAGGAVVAAKQATTVIPIIFAVASDPIGTGLVASLAHPGGNVTGLSVQAAELAGKRVELLRELIPNLRRLAIIANPDYAAAAREMSEVQTASRALDLETKIFEIHESRDISVAVEQLKGSSDVLYVCIDPLTDTNQITIAKLTTAARIPTMPAFRDAVRAGSLIYYGPNTENLFRRAADFVDKVLRGTKPADIPVEQSNKFDLVINIKTAKALGITVPQALLVVADEVIE
jgi:putative ABC transport system substrate-binding protein